MQRSLLWPLVIMLSALAAGLVNVLFPGLAARPIIVIWFLLFCPGMMLIRFFQLKEPVTEWTLAVALSITIDGAVTGIQMYSGHWSPLIALNIIICISVVGVIIQILWFTARQVYAGEDSTTRTGRNS